MNFLVMKAYMSLLLGCCLFACQEKKQHETVYPNVPIKEMSCENVKILRSYDSISVPEVYYLYNLKITDGKIILHSDNFEDFVSIYSYPQFKLLYSFGNIGQGPGEFTTVNWSKNLSEGEITLYDIMKESLYTYKVGEQNMMQSNRYALIKDEKGFALPFTNALQMNDSIFLMKEDGIDTKLHLTDLKNQKDYGNYLCELRTGKPGPYTAFDYDFNVIGDKILLAYTYMDRLELVRIEENNQLSPQLFITSHSASYDPMKDPKSRFYFLGVCTYKDLFFCLKSSDGGEEGDSVWVIDTDGNLLHRLSLDRKVSLIAIDGSGRLVAYKEDPDKSWFYFYS